MNAQRAFCIQVLSDFRRGGLALSAEGRAELQRLLDADAAACAKYGSNLGTDKTQLHFSPAELEGLSEGFIQERTDDEGRVVLTLK
eukprot:879617-Prymnesium_polylepis.2